MDDKILSSLFEDLNNFTSYINSQYIDVILKNNDIEDEPKYFLFTILYKLNSGLGSCELFIYNFNQTQRYLDSMFLVLRTLISDSLMCLYVMMKDSGEDAIKLNILRLYADHVKFGYKNLTQNGRKIYGYTEEEYNHNVNNFRRDYAIFFKDDSNFKYEPLRVNIADITKHFIKENSENINLNLIKRGHDLYSIFSKLEHLGILSLQLMLRQYDEKQQATLFRQISEAITVVSSTIEFCLGRWDYLKVENDETLETLIVKLWNYVELFHQQEEKRENT